jgi:hypothetical protein
MTNTPKVQPLSRFAVSKIVYSNQEPESFPSLESAAPTPLLEQAMQFVETHPERHDQSVWMTGADGLEPDADGAPICGTAGCLAGWGIAFHDPLEAAQILSGGTALVLADQVRYTYIEEYAAHLFGITQDQASTLFEGRWDAEDLRLGVDAIKDNPDITGEHLECVMQGCGGCWACD